MAVRTVIQVGHPSLKKKNEKIVNFKSPKLKRLQKDLIDTMHKTSLIGIAAPQIAENYMIFVTHPRKTKSRNIGRIEELIEDNFGKVKTLKVQSPQDEETVFKTAGECQKLFDEITFNIIKP